MDEAYEGEAQHIQQQISDEQAWIRDVLNRLPIQAGGNGSNQAFHEPGVTDGGCPLGGPEHQMLQDSLNHHADELRRLLEKAKAKGIPTVPTGEAGNVVGVGGQGWNGWPIAHPVHGTPAAASSGSSGQSVVNIDQGNRQTVDQRPEVKTGDAVAGSQVTGVVGNPAKPRADEPKSARKQEPSKTQTLIKSMAMVAIGALVFSAASSLFRSAFSHVGAVSRAPAMLVDDGKAIQLPSTASKPNADNKAVSDPGSSTSGTPQRADTPRVMVNTGSTSDRAAMCQTTTQYTSSDGGTVGSYSSDGCGQQRPAREQRTQTTNSYRSNSSGTQDQPRPYNSGGGSYNGSPSQSQPNNAGSSQTYQDTTVGQPTITYGN